MYKNIYITTYETFRIWFNIRDLTISACQKLYTHPINCFWYLWAAKMFPDTKCAQCVDKYWQIVDIVLLNNQVHMRIHDEMRVFYRIVVRSVSTWASLQYKDIYIYIYVCIDTYQQQYQQLSIKRSLLHKGYILSRRKWLWAASCTDLSMKILSLSLSVYIYMPLSLSLSLSLYMETYA